MTVRLAVAVSGQGRTLANLIKVQDSCYQVAAVIASRPDCGGCAIAREHEIPLFAGRFEGSPESAVELEQWLSHQHVEWIALAGFLKKWPALEPWKGRVVNIHNALLPRFGGKGMYGDRTHRAVLASGVNESGATVHFVNDRYDEGQMISQIRVPVRPDDDVDALAARVFAAECELYPETLRRLFRGDWPRGSGLVEQVSCARFADE